MRWTVQDLAEASGVSVSTIKRVEASEAIPHISVPKLLSIRAAFESKGIEFVGSPDDRPGIRIGRP
ncbi:helix-turn-helix transcriptional regulator [Qipengyuania aquimaris]|uniref:Helix-turn-helix transcriptional regulator n=1 Tax=Qipengyuania aquimaris TaxID=255984 RepID=A0A9Q3S0C6_9SPHN|nr:helix-turn-helix transcriptional regulator [Qipengyuania aquimaris]